MTTTDATHAVELDVPVHEVDREIYVMPAFATLTVADLAASRAWYAALGFVELAVLPPGADSEVSTHPVLVHLRRYRYQDLLLVPSDDDREGSPTHGARALLSFAHTGPLEQLETLASALSDLGTGAVDGPRTTPWFAVELEATDPDGHVVVLTARSDTPPPPSFVDDLDAATAGQP